MKAAQNKMASLGQANWFGNFLDARVAVTHSPETVPTEPGGEEVHTQSALKHYMDAIHQPALVLVSTLLERSQIPWSLALDRLAAPVARIEDTALRLAPASDGQVVCGSQGYLLYRMQPLVCGGSGGESADMKAFKLLATPIVVEFSIDFAGWMLVVSRLVDLADQNAAGAFLNAEGLLAAAKGEQAAGFKNGRGLLEEALRLLDLSIAAYGMLYGDYPARAALDALRNAKSDDPASLAQAEATRLLLKQNSYLAANAAMIFLRERYVARQGGQLTERPSSTAYRTALEVDVNVPNNQFPLLRGLFGDDLVFDLAPEGSRVRLKLADEVMVPLAGVDEFVQGKFAYPPRFVAMLAQRERVFDRLADYEFYNNVDEDMRASLVALMSSH